MITASNACVMRDEALSCAAQGRQVFPAFGITRDRCECGQLGCESSGKHPIGALAPHGLLDASADPSTIHRWWQAWPNANLAVRTGVVSGIVVLDVDPRHGGDETLAGLEREHGALPSTVEALTGSSGRHLYFRHPGSDAHIPSRNGQLGPGLDVKADGGYVIAPPSLHVSGRRYEWEATSHPDDIPLADMPTWLLTLVTSSTQGQPGAHHRGWLSEALANMGEGNRNDTLYRVAGWLRHYGATAEDIIALLEPHAQRVGLPTHELLTLAGSASRYYSIYDTLSDISGTPPAQPFPKSRPPVTHTIKVAVGS